MYMATRLSENSGKGSAMDKPEAERLYDSGKDPTVGKLLELDEENKTLKAKIAALSTDSTNSSKPPSSDGPAVKKKSKKTSRRKREAKKGTKVRSAPCFRNPRWIIFKTSILKPVRNAARP